MIDVSDNQPGLSDKAGLLVCAQRTMSCWRPSRSAVDPIEAMNASVTQLEPPLLNDTKVDRVWSRPWVRRAASCLLVFHLLAIVIAPMAVAPCSQLSLKLWRGFRPYLEVLYLNHGYHFFAPDPGPSHLVRYELRFDDGRVEEGVFPNKTQHKPRLLYHRHFMLSEFLNNLAIDDSRPELFRAVTLSYSEHLRQQHQAAEVTLHLRRHYLPSPQHVSAGKRLDAIELFAERPLGSNAAERR